MHINLHKNFPNELSRVGSCTLIKPWLIGMTHQPLSNYKTPPPNKLPMLTFK
jgi:hypothetical protein